MAARSFPRDLLSAVLSAVAAATSTQVSANPLEALQPRYGWREMFVGADAARDVWTLYSGVTLAPWSEDIHADGLRLRASSGYGRYSYEGVAFDPPPCATPTCGATQRMFNVEHTYVEAFVGYQKRFGDLTAKAFIGVIGSSHKFDVPDVKNRVAGEEIGAKAALELWLNLGPHAWSSLDLSHATAFETSSARWRGGWRALPNFSIGPEVRYDRNAQDDAGRARSFDTIGMAAKSQAPSAMPAR